MNVVSSHNKPEVHFPTKLCNTVELSLQSSFNAVIRHSEFNQFQKGENIDLSCCSLYELLPLNIHHGWYNFCASLVSSSISFKTWLAQSFSYRPFRAKTKPGSNHTTTRSECLEDVNIGTDTCWKAHLPKINECNFWYQHDEFFP